MPAGNYSEGFEPCDVQFSYLLLPNSISFPDGSSEPCLSAGYVNVVWVETLRDFIE